MAATRIQRSAVWDTVQFTLNGTMFVLLGEQLPHIFHGARMSIEQGGHVNPWWLAVYALAISAGLLVLRCLWVWTSLRLTIYKQKARGVPRMKINPRLLMATSLAGARGAITLAGVLTLPLASGRRHALPRARPGHLFGQRRDPDFAAGGQRRAAAAAARRALPRRAARADRGRPRAPGRRQRRHRRHRTGADRTDAARGRAGSLSAGGRARDRAVPAPAERSGHARRRRPRQISPDRPAPNARCGWRRCRPNATRSSSWRATASCPTTPRASWCAKSICWKAATAKADHPQPIRPRHGVAAVPAHRLRWRARDGGAAIDAGMTFTPQTVTVIGGAGAPARPRSRSRA